MKRILYWFYSLRPLWLMVVLLICSSILVSLNQPEKLMGIKYFSLWITENVHSFSKYFDTNYELREENSKLKKLLVQEKLNKNLYKNSILENIRLKHLLKLKPPQQYKFIFTKIIGNSPYIGLQGFIINKGIKDSIEKNDVVLSSQGLVGKVLEVQESTSIIQILLDRNTMVAASILRNQETGILKYHSKSLLLLDYVVKSVSIKLGDIVITAPTSQIYPEGLKIGKVVKIIDSPTENFQKIYVIPSTQFTNLNELIVLKRKS